MSTNLGARGVYVEWTSAGTVYRHNPAPRSAPPSWRSATAGYAPTDASKVAELIGESAAARRRSGVFGALTGLGATLATAFALGDPFAALFTGGVAGGVVAAIARRRRFSLLYDSEDRGQEIFLQRLDAAFASLRATTSMVAFRAHAAAVTPPPTHLSICRPEEAALPFDTNVIAPCWRLGDVRVAFLPDRVAIVRGDQATFAEYSAVRLNHGATDVTQELAVPPEALVVASTWRHTTRTGAPDRRYRDNPAVHIVRYGLLHLDLGQGSSMTVQTRRFDAASAAWAAIRDVLRDHPSCRATSLSIPPPAVLRMPPPSLQPSAPAPVVSPPPQDAPPAPLPPISVRPPEPPPPASQRPPVAPPPMPTRGVEVSSRPASRPPPSPPPAAMRSLEPTAAMPAVASAPAAPARSPAAAMPAMFRTAAMPVLVQTVDPEPQGPRVSEVVAVAPAAPPSRDTPALPVASTPTSPPPPPSAMDAIDDAPPLVATAVAPSTFALPRAPTVAKPASEVARWVLPGERIEVQGHVIDGGLVYVGDYFAERGGRDEPSLIRPTWQVAPSRDTSGGDLGYWPSYGQITPAQRGTYLAWLAGGRRDPTVGIGYVFVFFYGLERRVFLDQQRTSDDLRAIRHELRALRKVYGSNASFEGYSAALLDAVALLGGTFRSEIPPAVDASGDELPFWLRLGLAERAQARTPVDAPWAIAWHDAARGRTSRTVRSRCEQEVGALFAAYYRERFGDGLVPARGRARLAATYRAASLAFEREVSLPVGELTDPTRGPSAKAALDKIAPILQRCVEELDGYSRWLGRNPEGRSTVNPRRSTG